ncbi:hypothetical protein [Helicobacter sp. 11S02596-1]|uniref:hypothetical protein n=1 Tax=Helicobacter sp. 11S02596-1 TaxID=1476194 RepID=UPI000BA79E6E|nr:hypothetical protein [Helicobacter sp. 11S02596-1]PAF44707.1 hypothetical protein BJI48_01570 [Helicobacter sp. 11S02596-1]
MKVSADLTYPKLDFSKKFFTTEEDSEFAILTDEIKNLDNPRPLGLSGHLRVKNEARTIGLAIESCIDALDELIITAQPSIDATYEICQAKAKKYPDKIKLFYYTPEVVPHPFSHCFDKDSHQQNGDSFSVHNFAHYSNYGLVRISYRYYVKIDADQIYFTEKLKALREAILGADKYVKPKRSLLNKILGRLHRPFSDFLEAVLPLGIFAKYMTLVAGRCAYGLCGINLGQNFKNNVGEISIGGGALQEIEQEEIKNYFLPLNPKHSSGFSAYNGGIDTAIFIPNATTFYHYFINHGVETIPYGDVFCVRSLGCFWLHFGMVKKDIPCEGVKDEDYINLQDYYKAQKTDLKDKIKFRAIYKSDYNHLMANFKWHFQRDKKYLAHFVD